MTRERFRQIRNIFQAALERDPETRAAYLAGACAGDLALAEEVESLLAADAAENGVLDQPLLGPPMGAGKPNREGQRIGPYQVLRELGRGGMGIVYLARRADGETPDLVAVKILRSDYAGEDALRRFEQERSILASLNHPNIARLFEGGKTAEGMPYYAMEFVDGWSIDRFCDRRTLDVRARLTLFQQACAAVDCANRRGIVHRDIKPSNILVTRQGSVKLVDFGIAKLLPTGGDTTALLTDANVRPMTPGYASPDQIRGAMPTPASDVYSLGVVLYELLTGRRPYRVKNRAFHEVLRVVCEEEPIPPSVAVNLLPDDPGPEGDAAPDQIGYLRGTTGWSLENQLSGDLDSVLLKSLRKEASQRYQSAQSLSDDIARYLAGLPVYARVGVTSRLRKGLARRGGWLAAGAFLTIAIACGGIQVGWPALWAAIGAAAAYAVWKVSADREFARKVAAGPVWRVLSQAVAVAFVVTIFGIEGVNSFLQGFFEGWPQGPPVQFDPGQYWWLRAHDWQTFWSILLAMVVSRWFLRRRWAGRIILDASSRRSRILAGLAVSPIVFFAGELVSTAIRSGLHGLTALNPIQTILDSLPWALPWAFLYVISGRLEFRQSGVIAAGGFHRWANVGSYAWLEQPGRGRFTLTLNLRHRLPFLPPARLKVPAAKRQDVEMVMSRYLSEWPVASVDSI